jgi:hypothetical protein
MIRYQQAVGLLKAAHHILSKYADPQIVELTAAIDECLLQQEFGNDPQAHLKDVVYGFLQDFTDKSDDYVQHLIGAGSGVVEDHTLRLQEGKPLLTARKVVLALARQLETNNTPPRSSRSIGTAQFWRDVKNYYRLLP